MRQRISWLIILLLTSAQYCPASGEDDQPLVVASASIFADMAEAIAGEWIEVRSIVPIGGDPHMYEPTPGDAVLASQADLILRNGLTFEGWLDELIDNSGTDADLVLITEGISSIKSEAYENAPDPHAWMDAENGLIYVENITRALLRLLPEYKEEIEFNSKAYKDELRALHQYIIDEIESIPEKNRLLITSHDAFQYYGRKYGLQLEAILGTSTDAQAQTSDIVRLNKIIQESGVPAVFIETTVNPKLLQQLAYDNGVRIGGKLFSDSIGGEDSDAPTYIDMLRYNTDTIVEALTSGEAFHEEKENENKIGSLLLKIIPILLLLLLGIVLWRRRVNSGGVQ